MFLWEQKTLRVNARPMTYLDERDADGRLVLLLSTPRPQLPTPPSVDWNGAYIARDN